MKVIDGNIASPLGFSADGLHAGFKKRNLDFGWIVSEVPANVAGVYTTNKVIAAPLLVTKEAIESSGQLQAMSLILAMQILVLDSREWKMPLPCKNGRLRS